MVGFGLSRSRRFVGVESGDSSDGVLRAWEGWGLTWVLGRGCEAVWGQRRASQGHVTFFGVRVL